jgi:hypothetical protein
MFVIGVIREIRGCFFSDLLACKCEHIPLNPYICILLEKNGTLPIKKPKIFKGINQNQNPIQHHQFTALGEYSALFNFGLLLHKRKQNGAACVFHFLFDWFFPFDAVAHQAAISNKNVGGFTLH